MPEGDSVAGHARMLRPILVGRTITELDGTSPALRVNSSRIIGWAVESVRTHGKNLVIDLSSDYSILVHLGMPGRWQRIGAGRAAHGSARLVLGTSEGRVACYAAPTLEVGRTRVIDSELATLGPDLMGEFDPAEFMTRARDRGERPIQQVIMDQRVIAGIGNVYKSELLFLEGIHPDTATSWLSDGELLALAERARRLLLANAGPGRRSTTGSRARGRESWVYDRAGLPCRRCRTAIESGRRGERVTYWCPRCQRQRTAPSAD